MKYQWLAHHLVRLRFPDLSKKMQDEIITEAVCRAWCTFLAPDYRLMQACVSAAARRKRLFAPMATQPSHGYPNRNRHPGAETSRRPVVLRMSDYR